MRLFGVQRRTLRLGGAVFSTHRGGVTWTFSCQLRPAAVASTPLTPRPDRPLNGVCRPNQVPAQPLISEKRGHPAQPALRRLPPAVRRLGSQRAKLCGRFTENSKWARLESHRHMSSRVATIRQRSELHALCSMQVRIFIVEPSHGGRLVLQRRYGGGVREWLHRDRAAVRIEAPLAPTSNH
jgi:hypothetical protein